MNTGGRQRPVADELEIRNVIARLAMLADGGDLDEYASLFTEDAHWEMHMRPAGAQQEQVVVVDGRAGLIAAAQSRRRQGIIGPGSNTRHAILATMVTVADDTASARSYYAFYRNTNASPEMAAFGIYTDTFRKTAEGWKLMSRRLDPG